MLKEFVFFVKVPGSQNAFKKYNGLIMFVFINISGRIEQGGLDLGETKDRETSWESILGQAIDD